MILWVGVIVIGLIGGKILDKLCEKIGNLCIVRFWFIVVCLFFIVICFMLILMVGSVVLVFLLMCIGNVFNYLFNLIYWIVVFDIEFNKVGIFGGVIYFIVNLVIIIVFMLIGSFVVVYGYNVMFIVVVIVVIIGMVFMIFVKLG